MSALKALLADLRERHAKTEDLLESLRVELAEKRKAAKLVPELARSLDLLLFIDGREHSSTCEGRGHLYGEGCCALSEARAVLKKAEAL